MKTLYILALFAVTGCAAPRDTSTESNAMLMDIGFRMMQGAPRRHIAQCTSIPIGGGQIRTVCD